MNTWLFSRCTKKLSAHHWAFHFKGYFKGEKIESIYVLSGRDFEIGEDYLLLLSAQKIEKGILWAKLLKGSCFSALST